MKFTNPKDGILSLPELIEQVFHFVKEDPKAEYRLVIGTDSQTNHKGTAFVTALIVHRVGKGARFFCHKVRHHRMPDLRQRIYKETELSLEMMEKLKTEGMAELLSHWPVEVHLDVGKHGPTRQLIQQVVGWVSAVGYTPKIKPEAFGASSVADKYTKVMARSS